MSNCNCNNCNSTPINTPEIDKLHQKASEEYENQNLQNALEIYQQIITLNPIDEVALSCIMDIYLELNDKFNYYLARANVNISQNKMEYAIKDTKKAIELNQDDIMARRKCARLYKVDNQNLKAIDEFLKILELKNDELDVYFELVELYMRENSIDSAINIAKQGMNIFNQNSDIKNMLAQLYFKANNYKSALEVVEDDFLRIKILLQDEQNELAFENLKKFDLSKLDKIQKVQYYVLTAQYFFNTKDYDKALNQINEYTKLQAPDALSFQMKALIYEEKENDFEAHLNWGFCYKLQNKLDDAIVEFNSAYQINPNNKTVLIELARLYEINKEKFVAIEFWQKVYEIDEDEEAKNILAEFYYSQGNFKLASKYGKEKENKSDDKPKEEYVGLLDKIMNLFSK